MPNVLDIRRRIRTVRSTQQITKAMKMVATAKLRKAQERALNARPYANVILEVLNSLVARTESRTHPLLLERPEERIQLVVVTADKGLCGAFNTNIIKTAQHFLEERKDRELTLCCVGRKGRDTFRKRPVRMMNEFINVFNKFDYTDGQRIASPLIEGFSSGAVDAIYLLFNEFKSMIQQRIVVERLLPIRHLAPSGSETLIDYLYEQPPEEIFNSLLPKYVEVQVYRALLESAAAEHAARMTAMGAATDNAGELIDSLTLTMNRARQAGITRELIEIVSGAAALG
jgi:F-type H+-transporting ATPase subunit gamma